MVIIIGVYEAGNGYIARHDKLVKLMCTTLARAHIVLDDKNLRINRSGFITIGLELDGCYRKKHFVENSVKYVKICTIGISNAKS